MKHFLQMFCISLSTAALLTGCNNSDATSKETPDSALETEEINNNSSEESILICDTAKFASGAAVTTPTSTDLITFAMAYVANEGVLDDNLEFTPTEEVMISLSVSGELTYGNSSYATTSACVETLQSGAKQLVLHTANGHLDFQSSAASVSGISPVDGITVVRPYEEDTGSEDNNDTIDTSGVTVTNTLPISGSTASTLSVGGDSNITYSTSSPTIIEFESSDGALTVYDYQNTLGVGVTKTGFSAGIDPYNGCALESASVNDYAPACSSVGIVFDRTSGTISFSNTKMKAIVGSCAEEGCYMNGTMYFEGYN